MEDVAFTDSNIVLVLCHSFFHDAFRPQEPFDLEKFETWKASRFIANFIIMRQARLPEGSTFAVTSKNAFDDFQSKFLRERHNYQLVQLVSVVRDAVCILDRSSLNKLPIDEGVFLICDTLFSLSTYSPILVSNIPKKAEKAETFYRKNEPTSTKLAIPFPIYTVKRTETFLRKNFVELSNIVDEKTKQSGIE